MARSLRNVTANVSTCNISQQRRSNKARCMRACTRTCMDMGDFIGSLPARGRPIRECLSIGIRNLAAFPRPAEGESEYEAEG